MEAQIVELNLFAEWLEQKMEVYISNETTIPMDDDDAFEQAMNLATSEVEEKIKSTSRGLFMALYELFEPTIVNELVYRSGKTPSPMTCNKLAANIICSCCDGDVNKQTLIEQITNLYLKQYR
jgi:hypothetical protein